MAESAKDGVNDRDMSDFAEYVYCHSSQYVESCATERLVYTVV